MNRQLMRMWPALLALLIVAGCGKDDPVSPSDAEAPVVSLLLPQAGAIVYDTLIAEAQASDNVGVTKVEFLVDGAVVATASAAPWRIVIGATGIAAGARSLTARAYDAAGNSTTSAAVSFTRRRGDLLFMQFRSGARFVFDRWDLDENNQKDPTTKATYTTVISAGDGTLISGHADWFRAISTDSRVSRKDTLIIRVNETGDLQSYGFVTNIIRRFIRSAGSAIDPSGITLPAPTWDVVGRFNVDASTPLPLGTGWDITQGNGISITFTPSGIPLPVTINIKIRGELFARGETFTAGAATIRASRVRITATVAVLFNRSDIVIDVWFSDDPSGQVRLEQKFAELNLGLTTVPVPGDIQELVSFE